MNPRDPGLRRCGHCGAYDAWTGEIRRSEVFGIAVLEHECGVCWRWWRVPVSRPIRSIDVREERL